MFTLCDSICIKILSQNEVLAGVGNQLRVYSNGINSCTRTLEWKLKNKIHGIEFNDGHLLIFGEREFMVLDYNADYDLLCRGRISDWISSGKLLNDPVHKICLVTGHSVAVTLKTAPSEKVCTIVARSSCVDKSTVYCSIIVGSSTKDCTIFAGTAFGEIIIWEPDFASHNYDSASRRPILHRISGHNGVIFSIDVNIPLGVITTTSDDRSVRFWSIKQTETNYATFNWRDRKIISHRSVYGHSARVFKAKIINKDSDSYVISVGEDSYVCVWDMDAKLLFKRRHHFGATIWDFDYDFDTKTLFSASNDGNVISYNLAHNFQTIQPNEIKSETLNSEYLSKVKYVTRNYLIAVTNENKLIYRTANNDWKRVTDFSAYKCTLIEVFENIVAIAGYKILTLYKIVHAESPTKIFEMKILSNIIRSFYFLSETEFLACDNTGNCKYSRDNFQTCINVEIPLSKERWITAALKHDELLIVSNRQGSIFLYSLEDNEFNLMSTIKHVHGYLGATSIKLELNSNEVLLLKTAGHDCTMKTIKVDRNAKKMSIVCTESVPVSWIERVCTVERNKYVAGFNDNHFVVWEPKYDVVFQISCGGGHRCWDLILDHNENSINLIFIKNKLLYSTTSVLDKNQANNFKIPYYAWHIKSCNILKSFHQNNSNLFLVSGGEDNLLKFTKYSLQEPNEIQLVAHMSLHISSIKSVSVIAQNCNKFLIFSVGGRAQICITEYDSNAGIFEERANYMLKSNDFDRKFLRNAQEIDFDPETRFMSIEVIRKTDSYDLYLGCSDGYIRKFSYRNDLIEPGEKIFYDRCILHVKLLCHDDRTYLLTAATDGCICFWNLNSFNESTKPIAQVKHHESGINSFDVKSQNNLLFILTGGDDQNVAMSKVKINKDKFEIILTSHFEFLHTAQVNGVKISDCFNFFYTTGIDQNICKVDLNTMKLYKRTATAVADIKGMEIFTSNGRDYCIVYGSGIQISVL